MKTACSSSKVKLWKTPVIDVVVLMSSWSMITWLSVSCVKEIINAGSDFCVVKD